MEYNKLGRSGLKVSELSFGSWLTFGANLNLQGARNCMRKAFELGVNFFDNAEVYGKGKSEDIMGEILKDFRREDLVVSTKIFWGGSGPNDEGLSWKHLVEGTKSALKRLRLDYVDLLFCHRPDPHTAVEESVRAIDTLIRQGLVFYWGTSEWPAERIEEAFKVAKECNCAAPVMEQPQYNILHRQRVERGYADLYERYGLGLTIWSPLASGILTGKYSAGFPKESRLAQHEWLRPRFSPDVINKVSSLKPIAEELECSLAQLSIAWCLKNPHVSTVILGATNVRQLEENIGALRIKAKLNPEIMSNISRLIPGESDLV